MNYLKTKDLFLNFGLVNKFFYGLTLDSRAVKYLELIDIDSETKYNQVLKVIKRSKHLKEIQIEFEGSKKFRRETFWKKIICQALKSSNLKSLKILLKNGYFSNERLTLKDAQNIVKFGKNLENLELDKDIGLHSSLDEIPKIKTLKSLKVGYFSVKSLIDIAKNFQHLENLSISRITESKLCPYSKSYNQSLIEAFDTLFKERRDTLKKLRFDNSYNYEIYKNLFQNINLCQNLETLAMRVQHLKLFNCESIIQLKGLKELVIWSCDSNKNDSLNFLIKRMDVSKLKSLVLCDMEDREGTLFNTISNIHFPVLERLHMKSSGYCDKAVEALLRNCPNLKSAQLYLSFYHIRAHKSFSESISINTLVNNSIKNGVYIDFGHVTMEDDNIYGNGRNLALLGAKLKEQDYPSWLKYQELKRNFEEWCDVNQWSYKHHRSNF